MFCWSSLADSSRAVPSKIRYNILSVPRGTLFFVGMRVYYREKDFQEREGNFLSEGSRCGLDKEISPNGTYVKYYPSGLTIERPQMCLITRN